VGGGGEHEPFELILDKELQLADKLDEQLIVSGVSEFVLT
jgi:hypothetical protein